MGEENGTYDIKHRKVRLQAMIYEEQLDWTKFNRDPEEFKNDSAFITHLLSLGIIEHKKQKLEGVE